MRTHGRLQIDVFIEPSFQQNCYLLRVEEHEVAWVIDPGFPPTPARVQAAVERHKVRLGAIVLTHGHPDHIAGVTLLYMEYRGAEIIAPRAEKHFLTDPQANLSAGMGFPIIAPDATRLVDPGDSLELGPLSWKVIDVSGHSPGGVAYYCAEAGVVFTGDALFCGSIGRTDFPGSSSGQLLGNIRRNLLTLPGDTVVYSGHGPETTIREEAESNPFLQTGGLV